MVLLARDEQMTRKHFESITRNCSARSSFRNAKNISQEIGNYGFMDSAFKWLMIFDASQADSRMCPMA